jgi:hypothetical protein
MRDRFSKIKQDLDYIICQACGGYAYDIGGVGFTCRCGAFISRRDWNLRRLNPKKVKKKMIAKVFLHYV